MKAVIIEDEKIAADFLEVLIREYDPSVEIAAKLDSVVAAVKWLQQHEADLLFLDIHLADDTSFSIFEQVDIHTPVIFTTAFDEYAIKAFKLNSIDYLLKPIVRTELFTALDKFKNLHAQGTPDLRELLKLINQPKIKYRERFLVSTGAKIKIHPGG